MTVNYCQLSSVTCCGGNVRHCNEEDKRKGQKCTVITKIENSGSVQKKTGVKCVNSKLHVNLLTNLNRIGISKMIMGSIVAGIAFRKWKRALLIAFEEALTFALW